MYEVTVQRTFNAVHALGLPDGSTEPVHGHDWHVTACLSAPQLDTFGFVSDFGEVQRALREILGSLHHGDLNAHAWFADTPPSAENVARVLFEKLRNSADWGKKLVWVRVEEAPGCFATYRP